MQIPMPPVSQCRTKQSTRPDQVNQAELKAIRAPRCKAAIQTTGPQAIEARCGACAVFVLIDFRSRFSQNSLPPVPSATARCSCAGSEGLRCPVNIRTSESIRTSASGFLVKILSGLAEILPILRNAMAFGTLIRFGHGNDEPISAQCAGQFASIMLAGVAALPIRTSSTRSNGPPTRPTTEINRLSIKAITV